MRNVIAVLIGFIVGMSILIAHAEEKISGSDMICQNIGYLSTSCKTATAVPMEYYDREIAKEKAKQSISEEETNIYVNIDEAFNKSAKDGNITVKSWYEED
jgi:hypothetical protein